MSDANMPFAFSQFVPGFDFLKNLAGGASSTPSAVPGLPSLSSWVAPTMSVEEVDKRIQELKTVQYWLEQNGHALRATIQALEVQKMTLSTLRGMNLHMGDLASAFTRQVAAVPASAAPSPAPRPTAAAPAPAPAPAPAAESQETAKDATDGSKDPVRSEPAVAGGVVDPMQWWGALTQQFQQIASAALQDASQLKMPPMAQPIADAVGKAMSGAGASAAVAQKPAAAAKKAAAGARKRPAVKKPAAARRRAQER